MATGTRAVGDFCWINMLTPKPEEACGFFGAVLGWKFGAIPGMGFRATPRHDIPGIGRSCGIVSPQGVPFHVIRYAP